MAKIPEILKRAVENEDWFVICSLYTQITGEDLSPPQPKKNEDETLLETEFDFEVDKQPDDYLYPYQLHQYKVGDKVFYQSPKGKKPQLCEIVELLNDSEELIGYRIKMIVNGRKYNVSLDDVTSPTTSKVITAAHTDPPSDSTPFITTIKKKRH
jgi:hypothetical protein